MASWQCSLYKRRNWKTASTDSRLGYYIIRGHEWKQLIPLLRDEYTIYTIDLLGFGRSEKANMTYTNFLYVQMISDFIKSEIGHRTSIITSGEAASIPLMACANNPDLFDQIMAINPRSLLDFSSIPGKTAKMYKCIIEFPTLVHFCIISQAAKK